MRDKIISMGHNPYSECSELGVDAVSSCHHFWRFINLPISLINSNSSENIEQTMEQKFDMHINLHKNYDRSDAHVLRWIFVFSLLCTHIECHYTKICTFNFCSNHFYSFPSLFVIFFPFVTLCDYCSIQADAAKKEKKKPKSNATQKTISEWVKHLWTIGRHSALECLFIQYSGCNVFSFFLLFFRKG